MKERRLRRVKNVVCGTARASQVGQNCRHGAELEAGVVQYCEEEAKFLWQECGSPCSQWH